MKPQGHSIHSHNLPGHRLTHHSFSPTVPRGTNPHRRRTHRGVLRLTWSEPATNGEVHRKRGVPGHGPQQASMSMATCVDPQRTDRCPVASFGLWKQTDGPLSLLVSTGQSSCLCLGKGLSFYWCRPVRRPGCFLGFSSLPSASNSPRSITKMLKSKQRDERNVSLGARSKACPKGPLFPTLP